MGLYANVHCILQRMREDARANARVGPKVMVVGAQDAGKSSLCKLLCNYASRQGEQPTFVDLDIGQGMVSVPGMLSAILVERPIDPEDGFGLAQPIVHFFGEVAPFKNTKLYLEQTRHLHQACLAKFAQNADAAAAGLVINTGGWVDGDGYKILLDVIEACQPNVVLVLGHEKLYSTLGTDLKIADVKLVKLPKSGGVVNRDPSLRRLMRIRTIKEYFYGPSHDLCPHAVNLPFQSVTLYKIVAAAKAPHSILPLGASQSQEAYEPLKVLPSLDLKFHLVGVSYAKKVDELLESNIAGFVYIKDINFDRNELVVLSPCSGPLPGELLILSGIKYIESD